MTHGDLIPGNVLVSHSRLSGIVDVGGSRSADPSLDPERTVVAVDTAGRVLGSALMGPNRPGRGAHIATATFIVDEAGRGRGIGRALGEHVLAWARSGRYVGIQFNAVAETNTAAVHLWTSLGMRIVGTVPHAFRHPDHGLVGLHIMFQQLNDPAAGGI